MKRFLANIRLAWRAVFLMLWTCGMFCLLVCLRFLGRLRSTRAELRLRGAVIRAWARVALRACGFRLHVEGTPPPHPCFTVSNHLSSIDSVVFCGIIGGTFVARHDMEQWPLIGPLTRNIGIIFVNRLRRTDVSTINARIAEALEKGYAVHMYAESRIGDGKTVLPFKPALLEPAVQTQTQVHYAVIGYRTLPGDPPPIEAIHWGPSKSFSQHLLDILRLRGAEVTVTFGDTSISGTDRKELAQALWEQVQAGFVPLE